MLLSSSAYFIFLVAVFFLYWPFTRSRALALAAILFANYFFYAKWDLFYLALIPAASACDYLIALGIERSDRPRVRRLLVTLSVVMNLAVLACFKYMPLFLTSVAAAAGRAAPQWHWVFPLGISFYVFQSLSYTLDVYRRDAKPTRSLLAYLAAVSFFPTMLAGPITRPAELLPQLENRSRVLTGAESGQALFLIGLGLMKKLLIADYLGENLVDRVFDFPKLYSGFEALVGVWGYALQLYYDFSGYTDIAVGSALLLGLRLPGNFNMPYASVNIADFWRRWHITLSNWLRDYLYFSLPGLRSRHKIFSYLNLVITMTLGGLWHGANWTFAVWGLLHGLGLAATRALQVARGNPAPKLPRWVRAFVTAQFVSFAWIFFRASSFENARLILERIASLTISTANLTAPVTFVMLVAALAHYTPKRWFERARDLFSVSPFYAQAALLMLLAIAIQYVAATGAAPFIYTRF
jgi:D-alanyl-lipoteichoic acid acyltransferase DltB (MBOAT superfamily)